MALAEEFSVKPKYRLTIDRFRDRLGIRPAWLLALAIVLGFPVIYSVVLAFRPIR
jgi:multiple sugar transport system permease protein